MIICRSNDYFLISDIAKCLVGNQFVRSRKTCPSGKDVCVEIKDNEFSHYSCESSKTLIDKIGLWAEGCITISSIKYCACSGDYCYLDTSGKNFKSSCSKCYKLSRCNGLYSHPK